MSLFGSLTLEQVFLNLCRRRADENDDYSIVNGAMLGDLMDRSEEEAEMVRAEHAELVQNVGEEMGIEDIDHPEIYGPLLDFHCENNTYLAAYIEETTKQGDEE